MSKMIHGALLAFVCLASSATVKDLSPAVFSGLSKVYSGVPFQSRLKVKALTQELQVMAEEATKDLRAAAKPFADSAGGIPGSKMDKVDAALAPIQANILPIKTKIPIRIVLSETKIDSLRLTLEEDLALTPFMQIVVDTAR